MNPASHMANENIHLCFETFANPLRTRILKVLEQKPMNVSELTSTLEVERTRVSHSLAILRNCNVIIMEKQGKQRICKLNKKSVLHSKEQKKGDFFSIIKEHKQQQCIRCHKNRKQVHD